MEANDNSKTENLGNGRLNTWDVPEFLPGALPRANPVQRAFFEDRSKKVFEKDLILDKEQAEELEKERERSSSKKFETEIGNLVEIFPSLDVTLIQETYLELDCQVDETINRLIILSDAEVPSSIKPPSCGDDIEFPVLLHSDMPKQSDSSPVENTTYRDTLMRVSKS